MEPVFQMGDSHQERSGAGASRLNEKPSSGQSFENLEVIARLTLLEVTQNYAETSVNMCIQMHIPCDFVPYMVNGEFWNLSVARCTPVLKCFQSILYVLKLSALELVLSIFKILVD